MVAGPEGTLLVGRTLPGRGAWLHAAPPSCFEQAQRRNAFSRALRTPIAVDAVVAFGRSLA